MTTHLEYLHTKLAMLEESDVNAGAAALVRDEIRAEEKAQAAGKPKTTKPKDQPKEEGAE